MQNKNYKIKKELISFNLLTQERVGLNKPNRLYLLKPTMTLKPVIARNFQIHSSRTMNLEVLEL